MVTTSSIHDTNGDSCIDRSVNHLNSIDTNIQANGYCEASVNKDGKPCTTACIQNRNGISRTNTNCETSLSTKVNGIPEVGNHRDSNVDADRSTDHCASLIGFHNDNKVNHIYGRNNNDIIAPVSIKRDFNLNNDDTIELRDINKSNKHGDFNPCILSKEQGDNNTKINNFTDSTSHVIISSCNNIHPADDALLRKSENSCANDQDTKKSLVLVTTDGGLSFYHTAVPVYYGNLSCREVDQNNASQSHPRTDTTSNKLLDCQNGTTFLNDASTDGFEPSVQWGDLQDSTGSVNNFKTEQRYSGSSCQNVHTDSKIGTNKHRGNSQKCKKGVIVRKKVKSQAKNGSLMIIDNLFAVLVVSPLNVLFWQGLWDLLERNVFPESEMLSGLTTWSIGSFGILFLSLLQPYLIKHLHVNTLTHCTPIHQIFMYIFGFCNVSHWVGLWLLTDYYTGLGAVSSWSTFIIGQGGLCVLRCFATAQAPPTSVQVDIDPSFFNHTTRFRAKQENTIAYLGDTLFTVFIVHNLVILYWRGAWAVMDLYIYPEDEDKSAVVTLLLSFAFHGLTFALQLPFNYLYGLCKPSMKYSTLFKILLEHTMGTISNAVNVASWRGVWNLSHKYLKVEAHEDLSCVVTHVMGIGLLMVLLCGQSVAMKGCDLDGTDAEEDGCIIPNKYFRYFLDKKLNEEEMCDAKTHNEVEPVAV